MLEHKSKKSYYCVRVSASRREVLLSFDSRLEQSKWLERASKASQPATLSSSFHLVILNFFCFFAHNNYLPVCFKGVPDHIFAI